VHQCANVHSWISASLYCKGSGSPLSSSTCQATGRSSTLGSHTCYQGSLDSGLHYWTHIPSRRILYPSSSPWPRALGQRTHAASVWGCVGGVWGEWVCMHVCASVYIKLCVWDWERVYILRTVKAASSSRKHSKGKKPLGYCTYYLCKTAFLLFLLHMYVFLKCWTWTLITLLPWKLDHIL